VSGLALFGGTFDPVHNAHLRIAEAAADRCGLERVLFIPSGRPPHRAEGTFADYEDRFAMVQLACQCDPRFEPSRLEAGERKSYSIHTIQKVLAEYRSPIYFLIGADAFAEIETWYEWQSVLAAVTFIVVSRPGAEYRVPASARVVRLEEVRLAISSSQIRRSLALGTPGLPVPAPVAAYIESHGLYRSQKPN